MNSLKKILLIEDNKDDEILTIKAFRKNKLSNDIMVIRDGEEALDYFSHTGKYNSPEFEELPTFVLLDLKLPKVDGLQILKHIRSNERTKRLPVVILTTSKEQSDLVMSYELGVNSFVRKPIDFNEFMKAVNQLGMYWLILNENPVDGRSKLL